MIGGKRAKISDRAEPEGSGSDSSSSSSSLANRRATHHVWVARRDLTGWLLALPALLFYGAFVLYPLLSGFRYSFYEWDGIVKPKWVSLSNYREVFQDPELLGAIKNAFILIIFFTVVPVTFGLILA